MEVVLQNFFFRLHLFLQRKQCCMRAFAMLREFMSCATFSCNISMLQVGFCNMNDVAGIYVMHPLCESRKGNEEEK